MCRAGRTSHMHRPFCTPTGDQHVGDAFGGGGGGRRVGGDGDRGLRKQL